MSEQLHRLARMGGTGFVDGLSGTDRSGGNCPRVSLRILPFAAGACAAAACGPMTLLHFAGTRQIGVIHIDALSGGITLDGTEELARYHHSFEHLRSAALSTARSARLIHSISRAHDR